MKKLLALLLAMIMVVSMLALASCGSSDDDDDDDDEKTEETKKDKDDDDDKNNDDDKKAEDDSDYEDAVELFVDVFYKGKTDKIKKVFPKAMIEYAAEDEGVTEQDIYDMFIEQADSVVEAAEARFGEDYKVTYKITDSEKVGKSDLKDIKEFLSENGVDEDDVTEAYAITIELKIKGEDDENSNEIKTNAIKIDGNWYISGILGYDD